MEELQVLLDKFLAEIEGLDPAKMGVALKNPDGTTNYANLLRLIRSPEYSEYRKANPDVFAQAKTEGIMGGIQAALPVVGDIAKLGFSLDQIQRAKKIDDTPAQFPSKPQRNNYLRKALADSYTRSKQGYSAAERDVLSRQSTRDFDRSRQALMQTSGGQGAAVQAGLQVAGERQRQQRLAQMAGSEQARRQNTAEYNRLIPQSLEEDRRMQQHDLNKYMYRSLPMWRQQMQTKRDLMSAGLQNTFGGIDSLGRRGAGIAQMFKGGVPGTVYPNAAYSDFQPQTEEDKLLMPVFNNAARSLVEDLTPAMQNYMPSGPYGDSSIGGLPDPYAPSDNQINLSYQPETMYPWQMD